MAEGDELYDPSRIRDGYDRPPIPYEEVMTQGEEWCEDYYDHATPTQKGFITDFLYYTRGFETPTLSCIWTALFVLSSALKREVWYKWAPNGLYTNQYIIIIGPAGIVKKTTAVSVIGLPILRKFKYWIRDKNMYAMKNVTIVKDKVTPEAMLNAILPENKEGHDIYLVDDMGNNILGNDGKAIQYKRTSEVSLVVSELSTMIGKSSYAESMIPNLLDLYDAHKEWEWSTLGRGKKVLRNLHTTMLAGTTVEGLRSSIPSSAMGDGFLSRTIPVYVPDTKREYPHPFIPKNAPSEDELAKRLAWVASNTMGEFEFTKEAEAFFKLWYKDYKAFLRANPAVSGAMSRLDVNVYKTSLLMRAQRYGDDTPFITKEDLLNAIRLLDLTYGSFGFLRSQMSPDDVVMWASKLAEYIKKKPNVNRQTILQRTHVKGEVATMAIEELVGKGEVQVSFGGKVYLHATNRGMESYLWIGDQDERSGETEGFGRGKGKSHAETVRDDQAMRDRVDSEPHGFKSVPQKGRPRGSIRPKVGQAGEAGEDAKPFKEECGGIGQVAGKPPRGRPPKRKPEGHSEDDGLHGGSGQDLHVQEKEGSEGEAQDSAQSA